MNTTGITIVDGKLKLELYTVEELRKYIEALLDKEDTDYNAMFSLIPGFSYQYWGDETGSYDISYYNKPVMRFRDRGFVMYL